MEIVGSKDSSVTDISVWVEVIVIVGDGSTMGGLFSLGESEAVVRLGVNSDGVPESDSAEE